MRTKVTRQYFKPFMQTFLGVFFFLFGSLALQAKYNDHDPVVRIKEAMSDFFDTIHDWQMEYQMRIGQSYYVKDKLNDMRDTYDYLLQTRDVGWWDRKVLSWKLDKAAKYNAKIENIYAEYQAFLRNTPRDNPEYKEKSEKYEKKLDKKYNKFNEVYADFMEKAAKLMK